MKYYFVLFLFTSTFSYGQVKVSDDIKVKADKIRDELLNSKSLPSRIENMRSPKTAEGPTINHFMINTTRSENNIVDSVLLDITIMVDSLSRIQFTEVYKYNDIDWTKYSYTINQNGIIDWAYRTDAPKDKPKVTQKDGGTLVVTDNSPIIEISSNPKFPAVKNVDEKEIAMYKDRLKVTVDELYEMLFKK